MNPATPDRNDARWLAARYKTLMFGKLIKSQLAVN
jgi:hypothetical protein